MMQQNRGTMDDVTGQHSSREERKPGKKEGLRKWALFLLRWSIAVAGIVWVLSQISLRDRVTIVDENNYPKLVKLTQPVGEDAALPPVVEYIDPDTRQVRTVSRDDLVNQAEKKKMIR